MFRVFLLTVLILGGVWGLDAQNPNIGILCISQIITG